MRVPRPRGPGRPRAAGSPDGSRRDPPPGRTPPGRAARDPGRNFRPCRTT
ncbi:hypothetical protein STAFG_1664 [Streptomyces afghaniensis 772]|uniref:Uncharacterized protein n=1 Tax=Streptomyces afghaniensis 772 TaxID=1283301 RepID=S4MNZ6_9ACTN|nr:hypothetical protein STAFG_1664 [Streptomyces afghaniensis 772]